jgi:apolipoprotein D and lipocalin family protein
LNGYVVPGTGNARWRESRFWPFYLPYLYVDPHHQTAPVAYPGRLRLDTRTPPIIGDPTYQSLIGRLKEQGYDSSQFRRIPQTAAQIGNPGFQ